MKHASFVIGLVLVACSTRGGGDPEVPTEDTWTVPKCERAHGPRLRLDAKVDIDASGDVIEFDGGTRLRRER